MALSVFATLNVVSLFTLSDDLFTPDTPDAMTRFGFPWVFWQDSGPVALCFFSRTALAGNIAIGLASSFVAAVIYPRVRSDIRRTLQWSAEGAPLR